MKAKKAHRGFKAVQKEIAKKQGVNMKAAGAIVASGARKASKKAVKANPRLLKVKGMPMSKRKSGK
jgi:deoxyhypusine synthase